MTTASDQVAGVVPQVTLGWRLQMALAQGDVSAQQMADELGVARQTVSRWMNDKGAPPRTIYVRQWALRTGVPAVWLETGTAPRGEGEGPDGGATCAIRDSNPEPAD